MISLNSNIIALALTLLVGKTIAHTDEFECVNDDDFEFYHDGKNRSCRAIRFNEVRRKATCDFDVVSAHCPQSCGKCCKDLNHFTFTRKYGEEDGTCEWLSGRPKARIDMYCEDTSKAFNGRTVRDGCPHTCSFCFDEITVHPSASPTEPPTSDPTVSNAPTKMPSDAPSRMPADSPSGIPTMECDDDQDYVFRLHNVGKNRNCDWISKNRRKTSARQENYCGTSQNGHEIGKKCCKSSQHGIIIRRVC